MLQAKFDKPFVLNIIQCFIRYQLNKFESLINVLYFHNVLVFSLSPFCFNHSTQSSCPGLHKLDDPCYPAECDKVPECLASQSYTAPLNVQWGWGQVTRGQSMTVLVFSGFQVDLAKLWGVSLSGYSINYITCPWGMECYFLVMVWSIQCRSPTPE